jgi:hypothetical protein
METIILEIVALRRLVHCTGSVAPPGHAERRERHSLKPSKTVSHKRPGATGSGYATDRPVPSLSTPRHRHSSRMELVSFNGVTRTKGTHTHPPIDQPRGFRKPATMEVGLAPRTGLRASLLVAGARHTWRAARRTCGRTKRQGVAQAHPSSYYRGRQGAQTGKGGRRERKSRGHAPGPGSPLHVALGVGRRVGARAGTGTQESGTPLGAGERQPSENTATACRCRCRAARARRRGAVAGCALHLDPRHGPHVRNRRHAPPLAALQTPLSLS